MLNKLLPDYQQVTDEQHSLLNKLCTENQQVTINDESSFIDEYRKYVISVTTSETKLNFVDDPFAE